MKIDENRFKGLLLSGINFTDALLLSMLSDENFDTILNVLQQIGDELDEKNSTRTN